MPAYSLEDTLKVLSDMDGDVIVIIETKDDEMRIEGGCEGVRKRLIALDSIQGFFETVTSLRVSHGPSTPADMPRP